MKRLELEGCDISVGWGYRPSGKAAIENAARSGRGLLLLEDGFIRSLRPGSKVAYSLVADSQGIYYDAAGRSDLLVALDSGKPTGWLRAEGEPDVEALMSRFRELGISKYNWYPGEYSGARLPEETGVLVVDQTRGDTSHAYGGMTPEDFDRMIRDALDEHPDEPVYVRSHPDHRYRGKHSCFAPWVFDEPRIRLLPPDLSPAQCFSFCREIYAGTSVMGMEGLIHGCKVKTYGWNFYAGWGLTEDRGRGGPARQNRMDLAALFKTAYLQYTHYFNPDTLESCGLDEILDHLALQKEMFLANRGQQVTVGFSSWKKKIALEYLRGPTTKIAQVASFDEAEKSFSNSDAQILVWGRRPEIPENFKGRAVRVEDGFIRSKGLGAAFNFPYSWVLDHTGIYFDGGAPSNLENLFNRGFNETDLAEARELIGVLREKRLTKYNLTGDGVSLDKNLVNGRKVILVPGQVEADASIAFGSPHVKSNIELLRRVRVAEPDAFLIFKAHPDLVAGARHGNVLPGGFSEVSDLAVTEGNVLDWLDVCDEVHTMTSTVGFEALIRQVPVVTYGMPFYAAWGLTTDRLECPRRQRRLTLEELVCGALMKYPRYLNPATGEFTTALKVTRLLTSGQAAGDERAWHLKFVSFLKRLWVEAARKQNQG
ncbi:MAG: capsular polysaccharide biosynthesis protein [Verrucomicrobiota bacterium]